MDIEMTGMLASSKAGHDKTKVYVIVKEDDEYVYLADGKAKTLENPKKKNKKHIQIIKKIPQSDWSGRIRTGDIDNIEIRMALKQYIESIESNEKQ